MKGIRQFLLSIIYILSSIACFSQSDLVYRIGLILPLQTHNSIEKLDAFSNAHDYHTASRIHLEDDVAISLNFYEGVLQALNESKDSFTVELSVYDNMNDDSVTSEILKKGELKKLDIIIGSVTTSSAKLVADYCKRNHIINIQPFTPSKSLTTENPYHLKLAPTIDAHVETLFNAIVDSFVGSNVIIYTPDAEQSKGVAAQFDSLFAAYNRTASQKFSVALLNTKNMLLNGKKTSAREQLKAGKPNVLILTSFEESFVNGTLRVLFSDLEKYNIVVFGMPTWLKGEILRLDYVNDFATRISDAFYVDTAKTATRNLITNYTTAFHAEPTKYSYLGYDVMNFTLKSLGEYGKDFLNHISTQRYSGTAYKFDIMKDLKNDSVINYLENRHVNVFKVQDYELRKVW
ncbi:MAG: ABC transporter substrate-binding protein [Bacteroidota bacterium]